MSMSFFVLPNLLQLVIIKLCLWISQIKITRYREKVNLVKEFCFLDLKIMVVVTKGSLFQDSPKLTFYSVPA